MSDALLENAAPENAAPEKRLPGGRTPQVIVSNVAKHHAYETAIAAQKSGLLKWFYTSYYDAATPTLAQRLVKRLLPESLRSKVSNRFHDGLDDRRVVSYYFPELMERVPALRHLVGSYPMTLLKNSLFDRRVSLSDVACDLFHGFEGAAYYSMLAAKRQGALTALDYPIFHYETIQDILRTEYETFGVAPPAYLSQGDSSIERKKKEIAAADVIFVPTDRIAQDFVRYGKAPEQMKVIPYGFRPDRFKVGVKEDRVFRILFVGIVGFRKGVIYLLEAFKQLRLKNAELILVSPIDAEFLPVLAKYDGLFKHYASIPNAELTRTYHNASVFVFPSLIEGSAYVTYEAMASGLPTITTENAGAVVRDGTDGYIVPIRDTEALKERISWMQDHPKDAAEMGRQAALFVRQYTWERYHAALQSAYSRILLPKSNATR